MEEWPNPIHDREWVDADGIRWRARGDAQAISEKRIKQLLRSPEVRVLLFYGPEPPTEIMPADRDALWLRVRPYLRTSPVRARGDHTYFAAAEFKDDQRRLLLIIDESC